MPELRTNMKKSALNILTGIFYQLVTMIFGFIVPRLFLLKYGSEVNGLISSTNQLLAYLTLFEAGVGSATIQALYGLVGKRDFDGINGVMAATGRYYNKTGLLYLLGTTVLSLCYPMFLSTSIPYITISSIVFFSGIAGTISFFTFGKSALLLNAENKLYIINLVNILIAILSGILRIYLIHLSVDILLLQFIYVVLAIMQAAIYWFYYRKHYRWLNFGVPPNNKAISQKNAALLHQLSSLVSFNTDMLLITFFLGLKSVSVYAVYGLVFNSVGALISNIYSGFRSKLGQIYNTDHQRFKSIYKIFEIAYISISFAIQCTAYAMVLPFIRLYTAGVNDINYSDPFLPILFVLLQLLVAARLPIFDTAYFAGHIRATQWHTVAEAVINLFFSLLLVKPFGMYGVLLGTAIALIVRSGLMFFFISKNETYISVVKSAKMQLFNFVVFAVCAYIFQIPKLSFDTYFQVLLGIVFCLGAFSLIFLVANFVYNYKTIIEFRRNHI